MALRPVDLTGTDVFEIDEDPAKGTPDATRFLFRRLSPRLEGWVGDQSSSFKQDEDGDAVGSFEPNKAAFALVQCALIGWENFLDKDGNDVQFKSLKKNVAGQNLAVATPETMEKLSLKWIREFHKKISEANAVGDDEVKASGS